MISILIAFLIGSSPASASTFEECNVDAKLLKVSEKIGGKASALTIEVQLEPAKVYGKNKKTCEWMIGKKLDKTIEFESKNAMNSLKVGEVVHLDYSNFKSDDFTMEIWKLLNIQKTRYDLPD
ncbi:MAG: hypothetical protein EP326_05980 [Deltaproteobacteria bacterium]|nr:MAG: hypothetical protein EP326_05980 [Deltaproteobacteria bacterium]TNF31379.1 MAG: hypothetical protein EP319_02340 [Deltaproteobacteria bacterium]